MFEAIQRVYGQAEKYQNYEERKERKETLALKISEKQKELASLEKSGGQTSKPSGAYSRQRTMS